MILIEKTQVMGLEPTIRGMRNPMNSWAKSDSEFNVDCGICDSEHYNCDNCPTNPFSANGTDNALIGPNDLDLMLRLARAGSVDGKFRRMIAVYVDITAPLYWWKEFDTYKVGTVANSCSTMHKIHAKEFTLEDFSHEHLCCWGAAPRGNIAGNLMDETVSDFSYDYMGALMAIIYALNSARAEFLKRQDKRYWWQMIQLLPSSYNQKRTVMLNYEVLSNIYQHRRNHKLNEWRELCKWIEGLPYSEVITCNAAKQEEDSSIVAAITKLKNEQWSTEDIVALLLGQTKKEYMKLFSDDTDKMPVHGGAFEIPAVMADNTKND